MKHGGESKARDGRGTKLLSHTPVAQVGSVTFEDGGGTANGCSWHTIAELLSDRPMYTAPVCHITGTIAAHVELQNLEAEHMGSRLGVAFSGYFTPAPHRPPPALAGLGSVLVQVRGPVLLFLGKGLK